MKKYLKILTLILIIIFTSACSQNLYIKEQTSKNQTSTPLNAIKAENPSSNGKVVLYYRFNSENYLVADTRTVESTQGSSFEYNIINALLDGPSPDKTEMLQVINPGTKLLSITTNQEYIYITLSKEFIDPPSWAKENWEDNPEMAQHVYLTKRLAMYSIINTVTETSKHSKVQIYVDMDNNGDVTRVTRRDVGLIGDGREDQPLDPMTRNPNIILTPYNALDMAMQMVKDRNFEKNYLYVTDDNANGVKKPTINEYTNLFSDTSKTLISYSINPNITISEDGVSAVANVSYQIKTGQGVSESLNVPVMLYRDKGCWKVNYSFFQKKFGGAHD